MPTESSSDLAIATAMVEAALKAVAAEYGPTGKFNIAHCYTQADASQLDHSMVAGPHGRRRVVVSATSTMEPPTDDPGFTMALQARPREPGRQSIDAYCHLIRLITGGAQPDYCRLRLPENPELLWLNCIQNEDGSITAQLIRQSLGTTAAT
jgi:hypothetical protein